MRRLGSLRHPLDPLFSASSHVPILRVLQDSREGMSGRALAREARVNHQTCAVAVRNLESLGILQRRGSGRTQLVRLNFENRLVKDSLLPLFRRERQLLNEARLEVVETFKEEALSLTLFGSAARGQERAGSDLDVLIVVRESRKERALRKATGYIPVFTRRYGIRFSPLVLTEREAKLRNKRADPLLLNVVSEGIDLLPRSLKNVLS